MGGMTDSKAKKFEPEQGHRDLVRAQLRAADIPFTEDEQGGVTLAFDDLTRICHEMTKLHLTQHIVADAIKEKSWEVQLFERVSGVCDSHHTKFPISDEMRAIIEKNAEDERAANLGKVMEQVANSPLASLFNFDKSQAS